MKPSVRSIEVIKCKEGISERKPDLLAVEEPLEIRLEFGKKPERQEKQLSITMRTPGQDFELVLGFLFSEGIIKDYQEIENIRYCESVDKPEERGNVVKVSLKPQLEFDFKKLERHFYTHSACGVCGKTSIEAIQADCSALPDNFPQINLSLIYQLPEILRKSQLVFEHTGALHAAALFDLEGKLIGLREDVGRHNALDKLIGSQLVINQIPLTNYLLLVSGRASFELIQKSLKAGIAVFVAIGAPSGLAYELAKEFGMTLIGFLRDKQLNVYCGEERIKSF